MSASAWAATPIRSSLPPVATGHRSRTRSTVVVVSAARSSGNGEVKVVGGLGRAVLTAFTAQIPPNSNPPISRVQQKTQIRHVQEKEDNDSDDGDDDLQLSGSDVLQALQQAASKKKNKPRSSSGGGKTKGTSYGKKEEEPDYSHVKPLMIRSDWGKRIEDLERRLQQLSEF